MYPLPTDQFAPNLGVGNISHCAPDSGGAGSGRALMRYISQACRFWLVVLSAPAQPVRKSTAMAAWERPCFQLGFSFAVLLLLGLGPSLTDCHIRAPAVYKQVQLDALQTLWGNWNKSTPDPGINLAGWSSTQRQPCLSLLKPENVVDNWRGVSCLPLLNETATTNVDLRIIGLSLTDASIVGTLPPQIGNITTLSSLELSGNPNLSGPIPHEIQNCWLNYLDLHDNALNGTLPELEILWNLLKLDLSGNRFPGPYPVTQLSTMGGIQMLSLAGNLFEGDIPGDVFENKTQLNTLDLARNKFTGPVPNLTMNVKLQLLDLSGNRFSGSLPDLTTITTLRTLNLSRNEFTGSVVLSSIFNSTRAVSLSMLDLSENQLAGDLPLWSLSDLGSLQELYLDHNNITGILNISRLSQLDPLPRKFANPRRKLTLLSLTNNNITDVIYDLDNIADFSTVIKLQGNPFCRGKSNDGTRCYCEQICLISGTSSRKSIIVASTATSASFLLLLIITVAILLYRNKRYKSYLLLEFQKKFDEFDVKPTIYSYSELRTATRDFHPDMKLGEGAYGAVYKGVLTNGNIVAVKQLFVKTAQGIDEFLNEVVLITGIKHRNLVNLKGCCLRENQRLLVYEYVDNFDVERVLLGQDKVDISWPARLNILKGVSRGLHYLHVLAQPRIIHRDIKGSNILLDKNFEPKIADFGLALLFPDEKSHIMTINIAGTKGYLAPEYASLGQLSEKVDVYSFGVLCLEVVSGRKNIKETVPPEHVYLSYRAWALHEQGKMMDLVDPALKLQTEDLAEVQRVLSIALLCLQASVDKRPTMDRVVTMLQGDTGSEVVAPATDGKPGECLYTRRSPPYSTSNMPSSVSEEADESESSEQRPLSSPSSIYAFHNNSDGHVIGGAVIDVSAVRPR